MNTFYEENKKKEKNHKDEHHHVRVERKVSRSNCDLQHITLQKKNSQRYQNEEDEAKKDKFFSSYKLKSVLKTSKFKNKDKDMESIDSYNCTIDNNDESNELYKTIGKKIQNFSNNFESKAHFLKDLLKRFKKKVLEIYDKLNNMSNCEDMSPNEILKNKSNIMRLISFNEIAIFERKITEFMERQVVNYMKLVKKIESIFSENDINFELLNKFYNYLDKDNHYKENSDKKSSNDRYNFSIAESPDKLLNSTNGNGQCLTERDNSDKKLFYQRLVLPSLKHKTTIDNTETFRNSHLKQSSLSKSQAHKQFDLFQPKQRDSIFRKLKSKTEEPVAQMKNSENIENIIIHEEKNENDDVKISYRNKSPEDNDDQSDKNMDQMKSTMNSFNKEKIKSIFAGQNININKEDLRRRRKSVAALTMPNYKDINNVNDYILNYKSNPKKEKKDKEGNNQDKENEMAIKNNEENHDSNKHKKKKFKLKLTKDIINEVKVKFKENSRAIEEHRNHNKKKENKEENSSDFNSSENSDINSLEEKEKENKKKKKGNYKNLNKSTISNMDNKDPLDDIKYLHNIRVDEKELYRESSMIEDEKDEQK